MPVQASAVFTNSLEFAPERVILPMVRSAPTELPMVKAWGPDVLLTKTLPKLSERGATEITGKVNGSAPAIRISFILTDPPVIWNSPSKMLCPVLFA